MKGPLQNVCEEKMKIKVLHIIGSGTVGGAENFVYQLAGYQHKKDCEIESAIFFRKGSGYFYDTSVSSGLKTFSCKENIGIRDFFSISRYFGDFDILHFHGLYPALFFAAIISRRRLLYYAHGARALTKSFKAVMKQSVSFHSEERLPTVKGLKRFMKRQCFKLFLKYSVKAIHAPSEYYVDIFVKKYGIPKRKMSHLPLGIALSNLRPTKGIKEVKNEIGINKDKIIGCISTFRKLKRIDRLITGLAILLKSNGNIRIKLLIVGDGAERKRIEEQIDINGLKSYVILAGIRSDIPNLLNIMDIFVLPSESENFPVSIVEAMYFSLPFIVFQGSGGAEEIADKSGAGIAVKNENELADKMRYLLGNHSEAEKLGNIGYQYAVNKLAIERFAENIKRAYKITLNTN